MKTLALIVLAIIVATPAHATAPKRHLTPYEKTCGTAATPHAELVRCIKEIKDCEAEVTEQKKAHPGEAMEEYGTPLQTCIQGMTEDAGSEDQ